MASFETHYETLGVGKGASLKQITVAYRKLALKNHPDKNKGDITATERFQKVRTRRLYPQYPRTHCVNLICVVLDAYHGFSVRFLAFVRQVHNAHPQFLILRIYSVICIRG